MLACPFLHRTYFGVATEYLRSRGLILALDSRILPLSACLNFLLNTFQSSLVSAVWLVKGGVNSLR